MIHNEPTTSSNEPRNVNSHLDTVCHIWPPIIV